MFPCLCLLLGFATGFVSVVLLALSRVWLLSSILVRVHCFLCCALLFRFGFRFRRVAASLRVCFIELFLGFAFVSLIPGSVLVKLQSRFSELCSAGLVESSVVVFCFVFACCVLSEFLVCFI